MTAEPVYLPTVGSMKNSNWENNLFASWEENNIAKTNPRLALTQALDALEKTATQSMKDLLQVKANKTSLIFVFPQCDVHFSLSYKTLWSENIQDEHLKQVRNFTHMHLSNTFINKCVKLQQKIEAALV